MHSETLLHDALATDSLPTHLVVPKLDPITLTLPPPVVPLFGIIADDAPATSYDAPVLIDPDTSPKLITTPKLPSTPDPTLHATDVSDVHSVSAATVRPTRTLPLYLPASLRQSSTPTDPLHHPPLLHITAKHNPAASYDDTTIIDPATSPKLITTSSTPALALPGRL